MEIVISKMEPGDIPAVETLEKLSFADPWSGKELEKSLQADNYFFFAARAGEEVVGYAGAYLAADELNITNVAVFPQWKRKGAGRRLLQAFDRLAEDRQLYGITLEVRVSNEAAIELYSGCGYEKAGIRKHFYSRPEEDALIMWKYFQK